MSRWIEDAGERLRLPPSAGDDLPGTIQEMESEVARQATPHPRYNHVALDVRRGDTQRATRPC